MSRIASSATKIVLLIVALTLCIGFMKNKIVSEQFMQVVMLVLGAYYGASRGQKDDVNISEKEDKKLFDVTDFEK